MGLLYGAVTLYITRGCSDVVPGRAMMGVMVATMAMTHMMRMIMLTKLRMQQYRARDGGARGKRDCGECGLTSTAEAFSSKPPSLGGVRHEQAS